MVLENCFSDLWMEKAAKLGFKSICIGGFNRYFNYSSFRILYFEYYFRHVIRKPYQHSWKSNQNMNQRLLQKH